MSEEKQETKEKYFYATGRRKTSVARVRLYDAAKEKGIVINDKDYKEYFAKNNTLIEKVNSPLKLLNFEGKFLISVKVLGGGSNGQAEAVRLGIARALLVMNEDFKKELRANDYLTRDPRRVERKKPGLKKARRAPQWKKR
ncbi:MAG: 30S ribosomal protein S9 [Candidatus Pacebacteria bacterium]|nr:30S ribosomal protein S9 [Candidatus Paceibacterota bacterium]